MKASLTSTSISSESMSTMVPMPVRVKPPPADMGEIISPGCAALTVTIPAEVIAIIPTADRSKATVRVRIAINARDPRLLPEMGVRVSFLDQDEDDPRALRNGVLVPATALRERGGGSVVFVLDGDHVRERRVTPREEIGDRRLVEEGLIAGERVVRDPPLGLSDGMRVTPRGGV